MWQKIKCWFRGHEFEPMCDYCQRLASKHRCPTECAVTGVRCEGNKKDNPLNLAQRIILFNLLSNQNVNVNNFNMSALDGSISAVGYTSTASAITQTASTGSLYNMSV